MGRNVDPRISKNKTRKQSTPAITPQRGTKRRPVSPVKVWRLSGSISWDDDPGDIIAAILREGGRRDKFEHDLAIRCTYQDNVYEVGLNRVQFVLCREF